MKRMLYKLLPACLLTLVVAGCEDDKTFISIGAEQQLTTEISTPSAVFGENVSFIVKIDGMEDTDQTMQEDIDVTLTFTGKVGEGETVKEVAASDVFTNFRDKFQLHKGEQQGFIELTIKDNLTQFPVSGTLKAYARGYQISPAERTLVISDKHYTILSLRNNPDLTVREGGSFVLTATIGTITKEDVVISITADREKFEDLPESLTVKAGFKSTESDPIKIKRQEGDNVYTSVELGFNTASTAHPIYTDSENMVISIIDLDGNLGSRREDERHVYIDPDQIFYSQESALEVGAWDATKRSDGLLMEFNAPHPNETLAAKGWKFLNSLEFHPINSLTMGGRPNQWENRVPRYTAMQAVSGTQVYQAMNNDKYSNMTEQGHLMMWSAYDPGLQVTEAGSGARDYGVSGIYMNKFKGGNAVNDTWESSNVRILPGTRLEIRMRLRGNKRSFNAALWTQGNRDAGDNAVQWSAYGECDIFENPAGSNNDHDAWQTFHWADNPNQTSQGDNHNPNNGGPQLSKMTEFNIYWLEWRDNEEIAMGINGSEEVTIRSSQYPNQWNHWPFSDTFNDEGMHLLLTFGCGSDWALGRYGLTHEEMLAEIAKTLSSIPYEGSKTNPNTPRMEIDWIRFYKNDNYLYKGTGVVKWKNYPMY